VTARWHGPNGLWRTDPSTLPVDLYRVTQEPTVEQRGLRRVLDIEAGRHRARLTYRAQVALAIALLVLVIVPLFLGYALLVETVAHHWRGIEPWAFAVFLAAVFLIACRRQAVRSKGRT
jgi:hypothetical protein